jgi:YVTN family beta-propeller protein
MKIMREVWLPLAACALMAADYRPPAGNRPAMRRPGAVSVLPGGRAIAPLGRQVQTGPGPFGLAMNPQGNYIVTANGGPRRYSITVVEQTKQGLRVKSLDADGGDAGDDDDAWRSVFQGLAFHNDRELFASEGNTGRVRLVDVRNGRTRAVIDLNSGAARDSYSGDIAHDRERNILYVLDQANFRVVVLDADGRRQISEVKVGRLPFAAALSPDGRRLWVANIGMFEYKPIPGADPKRAGETGLEFPAFGFPSKEAEDGARRRTAGGAEVDVPGLGGANVAEANSVAVVNVENPQQPEVERFIRTGRPFGAGAQGGSSPSGVTVAAGRVWVSNGHNDSITVINAATLQVEREIGLRIPGLETLRGILPVGSHYDESTGWLLVAEAGINAIGVIDAKTFTVIGHIPAAWFPTRVRVRNGVVYVASAKGHGTGPNAGRFGPERHSFQGEIRRGSLSIFPLPAPDELPVLTRRVFEANGFLQQPGPAPLPEGIEHVVVIVKENRTFDEVFGDIQEAANGKVAGLIPLARFGMRGMAAQRGDALKQRLSLRDLPITPNHHEMARRFAFSDNFYADSEVSVDGHHWIVGSYPNAWTESTLMAATGGQKDFRLPTAAPGRLLFAESNSSVHPEELLEAGALWHHLERHQISFRNFGEGFELAGTEEGEGTKPTGTRVLTNVPMPDPLYRNTSRNYPGYNTNIPDQYRATQFISEIKQLYETPGRPLPRFLFIHLPNDHLDKPRPEDGYPYEASFMADNDYALGRIVEYLSHTKWWPKMAIFVTEDDAQGGVDHIDSHRTMLLVVSPYAKQNYVSHVNSSFPGILKTAFRLLGLPPLNLFDAAAADLADCFTDQPDLTPYTVKPIRADLFDPARAREPRDPKPPPKMDDPRVLQEQHRK